MSRSEAQTLSPRLHARLSNWVALCIAIHFVADFLLLNTPYLAVDHPIALIASQCGLVALWACNSRFNRAFRFVTVALTPIASWLLLSWITAWDMGYDEAVGWVLAFLLQAAVVGIVAIGQRWFEQRKAAHRFARFRIETLLLWVCAFAIWFGFVRFGHARWGWDDKLFTTSLVKLVMALGILLGLSTVFAYWVFKASERRTILIRGGVMIASLVAAHAAVRLLTPDYASFRVSKISVVVLIHTLITLASLAMLFGLGGSGYEPVGQKVVDKVS